MSLVLPIMAYLMFGFIFNIPFEDWVAKWDSRRARVMWRFTIFFAWWVVILGALVRFFAQYMFE